MPAAALAAAKDGRACADCTHFAHHHATYAAARALGTFSWHALPHLPHCLRLPHAFARARADMTPRATPTRTACHAQYLPDGRTATACYHALPATRCTHNAAVAGCSGAGEEDGTCIFRQLLLLTQARPEGPPSLLNTYQLNISQTAHLLLTPLFSLPLIPLL